MVMVIVTIWYILLLLLLLLVTSIMMKKICVNHWSCTMQIFYDIKLTTVSKANVFVNILYFQPLLIIVGISKVVIVQVTIWFILLLFLVTSLTTKFLSHWSLKMHNAKFSTLLNHTKLARLLMPDIFNLFLQLLDFLKWSWWKWQLVHTVVVSEINQEK
jgi:hypothetical protein